MNKIISTDKGPGAIGPYSQAVQTAGGMLFVSGQIPLVPATGAMVEGGIKEQATQVLNNLKGIVEAAGYQLSDVVKTTVYLADIKDFGTVNEIYGQYFTENCPARVCVEVSKLPRMPWWRLMLLPPNNKYFVVICSSEARIFRED